MSNKINLIHQATNLTLSLLSTSFCRKDKRKTFRLENASNLTYEFL